MLLNLLKNILFLHAIYELKNEEISYQNLPFCTIINPPHLRRGGGLLLYS